LALLGLKDAGQDCVYEHRIAAILAGDWNNRDDGASYQEPSLAERT